MRFSVVIPMYNSQDTIIRAIESIIKQTRADLIDEIIVVDDGSTDQSCNIVEEYSRNCEIPIVIIKKPNGGAASARNIGIRRASNDYIALLDADDEWLPRKIEIQNKVFEKNPEIRALGCNREGEIITVGAKYAKGINKISPTQYCIKNWPCTPSLIFDRSVFSNEIYFPEDMTHAEEGLFFLFLAYTCGLYYCLENLVICGGGKRAFGASGLSGDVKKMHLGVKRMIRRSAQTGFIRSWETIPLIIFEDIKYIRRKILVLNHK